MRIKLNHTYNIGTCTLVVNRTRNGYAVIYMKNGEITSRTCKREHVQKYGLYAHLHCIMEMAKRDKKAWVYLSDMIIALGYIRQEATA